MNPAELDQLADLVAARLESRQRADTYSPTLLTIGPNGEIQATFTGNVRAQGLELETSGPTHGGDPVHRVAIYDDFDTLGLTASIFGTDPTPVLVQGGKPARLHLAAFNPIPIANPNAINIKSEVWAEAEDNSGAGGPAARIIDSDNRSDFLRSAGQSLSRTMWGTINANGTINRGSGGFSCVRNAVGLYTVSFDTAFATAPIPVYSSSVAAGISILLVNNIAPTVNAIKVNSFRWDTGASTDTVWNFFLIGEP